MRSVIKNNIPERFQELGRRAKVEERSVHLCMSTEDLAARRTQNLKGERYRCEIITKFYSIGFLGFALIFYLAYIGSLVAASALLHDHEPTGDHATTRSPASLAEVEGLFANGAHMKCGNRLWDFFMSPHTEAEENRALALMLASGQCDVSYDGAATTLSLKHPTSPDHYAGTFLKVLYSEDAKDDKITFNLVRFFDYLDRSQDSVGLDDDRNNRGNTVRNLAGLILRSKGHGPEGRNTLKLAASNGTLEDIISMAANHHCSPAMAFLAQAYAREGNIVDSLYWDDKRASIHGDHESIVLRDRSMNKLQKIYSTRFYVTLGVIATLVGFTGSLLVYFYTEGRNYEYGRAIELGANAAAGFFTIAQLLAPKLALVRSILCLSPLAMPKTPPAAVRGNREDLCCSALSCCIFCK